MELLFAGQRRELTFEQQLPLLASRKAAAASESPEPGELTSPDLPQGQCDSQLGESCELG
jgi:hypothetical protein